MTGSAHIDSFCHDRLPAADLQPVFLLDGPDFAYPARMNCVTRLLDGHVAEGRGGRPCLVTPDATLSYADVAALVNRIANVLVGRLGLVPGGRVLLRSANTVMMVASYLAVIKAGGVVVATLPMLRSKEIAYPIERARIAIALCDARLMEEMEKAAAIAPDLRIVVSFNGGPQEGLEALLAEASPEFAAVDTRSDDVCLLGFTSGTTGIPKATMHYHRDLLAIGDSYGRHVLQARPDDRFACSAPLAFTFGLGALVIFPMMIGASALLLEKAGPDDLLEAIPRHRPTVLFTAPTAYRSMAGKLVRDDVQSLRICVSAGEALPRSTFDLWKAATGLTLMDGIGGTEMLHIFIAARADEVRPGATGKAVPGFEAKIVDGSGAEVPRGTVGFLAVRGPTGCRYLDDPRQSVYVQGGWNMPGDTFLEDQDGYFWYQARSDDMIVSSGYNIAGPEVEIALMSHPAVLECGVVAAPDPERGAIVKAYVVLADGVAGDAALVTALQDHVKAEIAPFKYPRAIEFCDALPKTPTGKLQRAALRAAAAQPAEERRSA